MRGIALPTYPFTDPRFVYVHSTKTDIQATWRRFGWQPLRERVTRPQPRIAQAQPHRF
jgi:hypothetical protein